MGLTYIKYIYETFIVNEKYIEIKKIYNICIISVKKEMKIKISLVYNWDMIKYSNILLTKLESIDK